MNILIEKRKEILSKSKNAKANNDLIEYLKCEEEYKRLSAKIHYEKNKDNREYKERKYNNLKKYLDNPDNYERHKQLIRDRNRQIYKCKKDIK